ncbi:MAG: hypothetical protein QXV69_07870 [Sulfolobaceae archaeon]
MSTKKAVSNSVFIAVVIVLIIIAAAGFTLYATKPSITSTVTSISTVTYTFSSISTSTITSVTTVTKTQTTIPPFSGTFYEGKVISQLYTANYQCPTSSLPSNFFPNASVQKLVDGCEVGAGVIQGEPLFVLVPAFAGLSIFGVPQLGSTDTGFPTFKYGNNTYVILTHCPAMGAPVNALMCPDHPVLAYSPLYTAVEQSLGITNGVFGLPEGVLPLPAHSHLIAESTKNTSIPWYVVVVLVFDPNIFPDPVTGKCVQLVPSNLTNPTANCLNSIDNLKKAMVTYSSSVGIANSNNPIFQTVNSAFHTGDLQVVVPGLTPDTLLNKSNSNIILFFSTPEVYPPIVI